MYSRYDNRTAGGLRVPENYSGCAFPKEKRASAPPHYVEVAKPTPYEEAPQPPIEKIISDEPLAKETVEKIEKAPPAHVASPFSDGLDFEQLLILGLILLLSHNGEDPDIVLWLGLLLLLG